MIPSSEMTAGRELDALIAEKVMGVEPMLSWQVMSLDERSSVFSGTKDECERWLESHAKLFPISAYAGYHVGAWKHHPHYSTDIACAWQVVEKMRQLRYEFLLITVRSSEFEARFWSDNPTCKALTHAAPLAICLASLKAVSHAD